MAAPTDAIRVKDALQGESTQAVGSDATNDARSPADMAPAAQPPSQASDEAPVVSYTDTQTGSIGAEGGGPALKEVVLRTAPQDPRFVTSNQARRCYVAYNEFHKCIAEQGKGSGDCRPYMRAYRSICPDEWIERWQEQRESGTWQGKF